MNLILTWVILLLLLILPFLIYAFVMNYLGNNRKWNINIDPNYEPTLTLIISTYNEEKVIEKRLENLLHMDYPANKIEVIHVDSASTDSTVSIAKKFVMEHPELNIKILEEKIREGKGKALNHALLYANNEVIITSDADSFLAKDSLRNIVKFLADPTVAAATGREILLNPDQSSLTKMECNYLDTYYKIKLGESKVDSTIVFQGELSGYKKIHLEKFEDSEGGDDSSTALDLVQKGYRTLFVPDATFFDSTASSLKGKRTIKIRRAQHQILLWFKCLNLLIRQQLKLNHWIALGEIIFYIINPVLFLIFISLTFAVLLYYPVFLLVMIAAVFLLLLRSVRTIINGYVIGNLILLTAMIKVISGDKHIIWKKADETRIGGLDALNIEQDIAIIYKK